MPGKLRRACFYCVSSDSCASAQAGGGCALAVRGWQAHLLPVALWRGYVGTVKMSVKDTMRAKLESALKPLSLDVIDDSAKHAGHMLHPGGVEPRGETHFTVKVVSEAFAGKSRLERHRMVNALLAQELADGVHALAIQAKSPGE